MLEKRLLATKWARLKCTNLLRIYPKIHLKWRVGGFIFGDRGLHFGNILGAWTDSGSQTRLGRRLGRLLGDSRSQDGSNLGPKMASSGNTNRSKVDAQTFIFLMAL